MPEKTAVLSIKDSESWHSRVNSEENSQKALYLFVDGRDDDSFGAHAQCHTDVEHLVEEARGYNRSQEEQRSIEITFPLLNGRILCVCDHESAEWKPTSAGIYKLLLCYHIYERQLYSVRRI